MKRMLKILLTIAAILIILILCLIVKGILTPFVPDNYTETVPTGGPIEAKYLQPGAYDISYFEKDADEALGKYEVYYPTELEESDGVYPVVVFANGTGVVGSKYKALFEHLASWGFVVIGNEDNESWSGLSSERSLLFLIEESNDPDSIFYGKLDLENVGISGHSQGGVAVFNAITEHKHSHYYKTAVALSPTNEEQAVSVKWHYDLTKIKIPVMLIAGTKGDFETKLVIPLEKMISMYDKLDVDKIMMRKTGYEHGEMLYQADGYVTAWFMWQLQGDGYAAEAFTGENPEIMNNGLYQDQRQNLR